MVAAASAALCIALPARAQVTAFPTDFTTRDITTNGATIHVRVGGHGPAVVLLHGFGDTGDMWAPLAAVLERDHLVIVPDLRGMGLSSHPAEGYHKRIQATDIAGIMDTLGVDHAAFVAHDIGNMVAFAFATGYPHRMTRLVLMDAPIPGVANWDELSHDPKAWHFYFYGPDEERLVAGRERIFLDRFYDELSAHPEKIDEKTREHYAALYARPGAMHSALSQFHAFPQDAIDNKASLAHGKLSTPVLAIGGSASYGTVMATIASAAFTTVDGRVIANAGHWLMEEQPAAVIAVVVPFVAEAAKP
ncbi:MAG TPA: alpha/beta hydrolase [Gemmatimonadaceae bacterium]|nr:alpha/beta hydrolase [Gemmatimonadaceae bacterium]